ncbi:uncharacterized protein LOC120427004 [Culex pipiens pallens]|uniref:uncharacterized protein LOC120427004 n=1 Tax=Culex pipiens pallens TaxID=42434 RepID=UPI001953ACBA|nr:uncharacterized protein LOC120427004 [Culex pipiens pallens]
MERKQAAARKLQELEQQLKSKKGEYGAAGWRQEWYGPRFIHTQQWARVKQRRGMDHGERDDRDRSDMVPRDFMMKRRITSSCWSDPWGNRSDDDDEEDEHKQPVAADPVLLEHRSNNSNVTIRKQGNGRQFWSSATTVEPRGVT